MYWLLRFRCQEPHSFPPHGNVVHRIRDVVKVVWAPTLNPHAEEIGRRLATRVSEDLQRTIDDTHTDLREKRHATDIELVRCEPIRLCETDDSRSST